MSAIVYYPERDAQRRARLLWRLYTQRGRHLAPRTYSLWIEQATAVAAARRQASGAR